MKNFLSRGAVGSGRVLSWILVLVGLARVPAAETPPLPTGHETRAVEGWTVRVDTRLMSGVGTATGSRALRLLEARLIALGAVVPAGVLERLRQVPIQIDLTHGALRPMQYHPSTAWLEGNGYATNLARCVHIPDAAYFASSREAFRQPMAILHELAHAYHDQVLGFDEARIRAAWQRFRAGERYQSVLTIMGGRRPHYGLTDPKEFFAEMTEAYFGCNDFFPFVAGELEREEPEIFSLLRDIWGPLPGR